METMEMDNRAKTSNSHAKVKSGQVLSSVFRTRVSGDEAERGKVEDLFDNYQFQQQS